MSESMTDRTMFRVQRHRHCPFVAQETTGDLSLGIIAVIAFNVARSLVRATELLPPDVVILPSARDYGSIDGHSSVTFSASTRLSTS